MLISNETLLITDSDLIKLQEALKKSQSSFKKAILILVLILPIAPFFQSTRTLGIQAIEKFAGTYKEPHYDLNWYLHKLIFFIVVLIALFIYVYYKLIVQIKKDIQVGTKFRTKTIIKKDDDKKNINSQKGIVSIEFATKPESPQLNLWYYIKKNIVNNHTKVNIPLETYESLEDNEEAIVEYSTYSKTFLSIKKI
jgi:hypothetical protein